MNKIISDNILKQTGLLAYVDKTGVYRYVNEQWQKTTGITAAEAGGMKASEIMRGSQADTSINSGRSISGMMHYTCVTGKKFSAAVRYRPLKGTDGNVSGCAVELLFDDMTDAVAFASSLEGAAGKIEKLRSGQTTAGAKYTIDDIIGISRATEHLKDQILTAAGTGATCLIEGETGTGKELVAHAIHNLSSRSAFPFVRVNCSAIPETLMESEFFGYEEGSFTGGVKGGRTGKFEEADHGSIFLDEINAMNMTMQPKLLRALQEREIERIGGSRSIPVDDRIIAASNKPLAGLVAEGGFRQDLFYRLNIIHIVIPPLRERSEDIEVLSESFMKKYNAALGRNIKGISHEAYAYLKERKWPGNIRELQNNIERAMIACRGDILTTEDFEMLSAGGAYAEESKYGGESAGSADMTGIAEGGSSAAKLSMAKEETEKREIRKALKQSGGNKSKAARILGISRTLLYRKLNKYDIM